MADSIGPLENLMEEVRPRPNGGGGIAKVRYTHDAMIDLIIAQPSISQNALAAQFGYTASWVSQIIASDAFQSRLADRTQELVDPTIRATVKERFEGTTTGSCPERGHEPGSAAEGGRTMQTPAMPEAALVRELLLSMKRIRAVDEAIVERYPRGEMRCPTHLSIGQEAVPAAAGCVLRHEDFAVSTHRSHGHYVGKGGDLGRMVAEIFGKRTGCSAGKGGSMHLIDPAVGFMGSTAIVGGTIPVGVGLGLSIKLQETDRVSCVFLGDAAVEEGVFAESLNFAVLKELPVLFVCENNLYSVYSPLRVRQPQGRAIHRMAEGFGIAVAAGDGNDALGACALLRAAVAAIRNGEGPRFLEFATSRWACAAKVNVRSASSCC